MDTAQRIQLAISLQENEYLNELFVSVRNGALEALSETDATDADTIRKHQATVRVVDDLRAQISNRIASGKALRPPGIA